MLPSATEIVYALGLGDQLVGVTFECDEPASARRDKKVVVGGRDTTGMSPAAIDAYGRILPGKLLGQGVYGNIDVVLPPALKPTPFDQWGDIPFALLLAISGALMFQNRNATLRRNGNGRPSL